MENQMRKLKSLFRLFLSMFKIGLFTFGGGYAMINLLDNEFVNNKKWINSDEFLDLVAIAESTPGPIAINCSTYIGYKREGILGAIVATIGMCVPSFVIIYCISLFFDKFLSIIWVSAAFKGIQACVVFLIFSAGVKMLKKVKKTPFNITAISVTVVAMVVFSMLSIKFSSIFYILIFSGISLLVYSIKYINSKSSAKEGEK